MQGKKAREADMIRVQAALTKFRSMTPMLTGFLRGITGDKSIRLVAGSETKTSKSTVTIAPPIGLGADYRHPSRRACGDRDELGIPTCEGCRAWEEVFVSLLHEMSHVAFTRIESAEFHSAYRSGLPIAQEVLGIEGGPFTLARDATRVDPYLPMVANSLEDIRVDSAMVAQRPGVEAMQRASYASIMSGELEMVGSDGNVRVIDWAEADATAQVILSLISVGLGYGVHESMKPEVADFVQREDISQMCFEVAGGDLEMVIIRSAEIIKAGREAGFFPLQDPEQDEGGGGGESGEEGEEGESGEGGSSGDDGGQSGEIPGDLKDLLDAVLEKAHDSDGSQAREDAGQPDQPRTPGAGGVGEDNRDIITAVLAQEGWTDDPSAEFSGVNYKVWPTSGDHDCGQKPSEAVLGPTLGKLRAVLAPNQYHLHSRHLRTGRLDSRVLGRRAPVGDERMFMRKQDVTKRDFFFILGLDVSGSTGAASDADRDRDVIDVIVSAAWAQAELLDRIGVPFAIVTHTASGGWGGELNLELREIKGPDEPWNRVTRNRLRSITPQLGNLDARAMVAFRKMAERHRAREKFIIQYSDGEFPVTNIDDEKRVIAEEIEIHRRTPDLHFMMVGIECSSPERFGFDFVRVDSENETMKVVNQIERAVR